MVLNEDPITKQFSSSTAPPPHTPQALISSFNVRNWQLKLSQWSAYNKSSEKLNELGCNYYPPPAYLLFIQFILLWRNLTLKII